MSMVIATFDTHRIVKRLKEAGASDALAETVTDVIRETRESDLSQLATKADVADMATKTDLQLLRKEIDQRFEKVDQRFELLEERLRSMEQRITIKLGSMLVVAIGVVATLVRLL